MLRLASTLILLAAGAVHAQPAGKHCGPIYADSRLVATPAGPVLCFNEEAKSEKCYALSPKTTPKPTAAPAAVQPAAPAVAVREEAGVWSACAGTTCKKVGKKLAKALKKAKAEAAANEVTFTAGASHDLQVVIVDRTLWNVARDKPVKVKPPKDYSRSPGDKPELLTIEAAGPLLLTTWADCAGPCAMSIVIDAKGKNMGAAFPSGIAVVLDDKRVVVVPSEADGQVTVLDVATGKYVGLVTLSDGAIERTMAAKLDDSTVVASWVGPDHWEVAWISAPPGKAPTITGKTQLAICQ